MTTATHPPGQPQKERGMFNRIRWIALVLCIGGLGKVAWDVMKSAERRDREKQVAEAIQRRVNTYHRSFEQTPTGPSWSMHTWISLVGEVETEFARGAEVGGDEGAAMRVMAGFMGGFRQAGQKYAGLVSQLRAAGSFNATGITGRQELEKYRAMARETLAVHKDFAALLTGASSRLQAELDRAGVKGLKAAGIIHAFAALGSGKTPDVFAATEDGLVLWQSLIEVYDLLEAEWGQWKIFAEGPVFERDAANTQYLAILNRLTEICSRQPGLQCCEDAPE